MEIFSVESREKALSLFKNSTSLSKSIELALTTQEVTNLHQLLSKLNRNSGIKKTEGYIHLASLMDDVDKVLKRTKPDYSTINAPTREVLQAKVNICYSVPSALLSISLSFRGGVMFFGAWRGPVSRHQAFGPIFIQNRVGALVYFYPSWGGPGPLGPLQGAP